MTILLVLLTFALGVVAILYAWLVHQKITNFVVDDPRIMELSQIIHKGAMAFLKKEYTWLACFVGGVTVLLLGMWKVGFGAGPAFAFLLGALCSAATGWLGMYVATQTNGRTTFAATRSPGEALEMAFSGGSVVGMLVVGVGLAGIAVAYLFLSVSSLAAFGMGASSIALFARVGGGIYTKAADVGADLVGKVEAGIPEDDPRNPAVIADNVGDNVGDVAGMSADLFESYVNSVIAAMTIGLISTDLYGGVALGIRGVAFPMLLAGWGIFSSIIGCLLISSKVRYLEKWVDLTFHYIGKIGCVKKILDRIHEGDAAFALRVGIFAAGGIMILGTFVLSLLCFFTKTFHIFLAVTSGVLAGVLIGYTTELYTSSDYSPVKDVANASETGPATVILAGFSLGMKSLVCPVILIVLSILISHWLAGVFGVACAAVGMLSITGIALSVDAYGPIADNAGGIAQMSQLPPDVRKITDKLDSIGNTTAAMGKGLAIGSAALTALALFVAYSQAAQLSHIDLMDPKVIVGMLLGGMLPFLLCAFCIEAVGRAAQSMIAEVRRQFRDIAGIMEGTAKPEYEKCVSISTAAALKEMIIPGILALVSPLAIGLILGKAALGGFLGGAIVTGVMLALFMANAGGAWDNAKKYIEEGNCGGKGTPNHAAAVVGDTVGDPFKDTAGPSLNILIKLMTVVALVMAPLFV
ncbi:MAG: sodium-translocating pyrophosphatase [Synergistaceae bacterium]|nr:sodium-translocating pyrophosphatase [Synergistaceae bacterium]